MSKNNMDSSKSKGRLPLYISTALIGALVICYFTIPSVEQFFTEAWTVLTSNDEKRIEQWVSAFGWLGPVVLILAMVVQMFLIIIPSIALMVVSVLAYGPIWGSVIILLSVFTASSVGYAIGNYFGDFIVEKIIGSKTEQKIEDFIDDYGFWAVVVTRINPFLSNDAISFVAGILNMGYWRFIGATMLGITPLTIFIAIVGQNTESLKSGLLWGSLVCLVIFGVYIYWDKKK